MLNIFRSAFLVIYLSTFGFLLHQGTTVSASETTQTVFEFSGCPQSIDASNKITDVEVAIEYDQMRAAVSGFLGVLKSIDDLVCDLPRSTPHLSKIQFHSEKRGESAYSPIEKNVEVFETSLYHNPGSENLTEQDLIGIAIHETFHSYFYSNLIHHRPSAPLEESLAHRERIKLILFDQIEEANSLPIPWYGLRGPFDELFADFGAALVLENPKVVSDFARRSTGKELGRDFLGNYPIESWDVGPLVGPNAMVHRVFDPVRPAIWKFYLSLRKKLGNLEAKRESLKRVLSVSIRIMDELVESQITFGGWSGFNQENLNRKFLEYFSSNDEVLETTSSRVIGCPAPSSGAPCKVDLNFDR